MGSQLAKRTDAMTFKFKIEEDEDTVCISDESSQDEDHFGDYKDEDNDNDEDEDGDGDEWDKRGNDLKLSSNRPQDGAKVLAKVIKSMKKVRRVHISCEDDA